MNISTHRLDQKNSLTAGMKQLLLHWYSQKFIYNKNTTELMEAACDLRNKSALSIVALIDVEPELMIGLMDKEGLKFVQTCHAYLRSSVQENSLG